MRYALGWGDGWEAREGYLLTYRLLEITSRGGLGRSGRGVRFNLRRSTRTTLRMLYLLLLRKKPLASQIKLWVEVQWPGWFRVQYYWYPRSIRVQAWCLSIFCHWLFLADAFSTIPSYTIARKINELKRGREQYCSFLICHITSPSSKLTWQLHSFHIAIATG